MTTTQIKNILQKSYDPQRTDWHNILRTMFKRVELFDRPTQLFDNQDNVQRGGQFGIVKLEDGKSIALFEVEVADNVRIAKNRVALREIAVKYIDQSLIHGALVFYFNKNQREYRLSFMARQSELSDDGIVTTETQPKRFTYLLGESEPCTTPAKRISELIAKNLQDFIGIKNVIEAFSVEKLSKQFFTEYKEIHYSKFITFLTGEDHKGKRVNEPHLYLHSIFNNEPKTARDFVKKLLGRLVFMHFLQKKGWLGCPKDRCDWKDGDPAFLQNLFKNYADKDHFLTLCLNELFFNTLNNDRHTTNSLFPITDSRVPYLNGGLFDRDKSATETIDLPPQYFADLLDFFEQYNFTIDENDPEEQEVGIDPEMLGHIFENLLEDNKDKGAFYTPKEIVQYMCQESLVQYLKTHLDTEGFLDEAIEQFVRYRKVTAAFEEKDMAHKINRLLKNVKICDPAIGSGAFPIGLLQEIYKARLHIYPFLKTATDFSPAKVKKEIIQNSIYGVDKDGGAVDIARLRFWLALIVDEDVPEPLPNLDYKIMQGDSLLESFEGIPLDKIAQLKKTEVSVKVVNPQIDIFGNIQNGQTEFFTHDTAGVDFSQLLDDYFDATTKKKIELHTQIDTYVLENIYYNLEIHSITLQTRFADAEKRLNTKLKALSNDSQRQTLLESKDAEEVEKLKTEIAAVDAKFDKLKALQDSSERPFFLWRTYFKDVFDEGGFNIVIGNPPYIQLQKEGGLLANMYERSKYETFERTGDMYALFYEKSNQILKKGGISCLITSNKWMRAAYGQSLRQYFLDNTNPLCLVDFGGVQVFDSATVDTNILIFQKGKNQYQTTACVLDKTYNSNKQISDFFRTQVVNISFTNADAWVVLSKEETIIKQKIEKVGKPLKEWEIQINYGIKTGFNEAFIINAATRDALIAEDPKSVEIIRPILRGKDIKKYKAEFADLYLIATLPSLKIDIEDYPSVKKHLLSFGKERLEQSGNQGSRKKTGNKWFETQDAITYWKDFEKAKIIYPEITKYLPFVYDDKYKYFSNNKSFIITGKHIEYLVVFFNSALFKYCFRDSFPELLGGTRELRKVFFDTIPVKTVSNEQNEIFATQLKRLLQMKKQNIDTQVIENELDKIIFHFYEITEIERNQILNSEKVLSISTVI
jgi:Eco57I restriction-modification methylase/TaqI-like C-terminal specificity domain